MTHPVHIDADTVERVLTWPRVVEALKAGHQHPRAEVGDVLLGQNDSQNGRKLLNRAAWISGFGLGLKTVTIFPENAQAQPPRPTVQGVFVLFDEAQGHVVATIDGAAITRWKTVGDSLLAATMLAPKAPKRLLIVGAGTIAATLAQGYAALYPDLGEIVVHNRTRARAEALVAALRDQPALAGRIRVATDELAAEVARADIIETATLAKSPIIEGAWLCPGQHLGLIGAYAPDMREADDAAMQCGRLFVDARETTLGEIGELIDPVQSGAIKEDDVLGDFYDLVSGQPGRAGNEDITVFKNGGGAHLDLMTATAIHRAWLAESA